MDIISEGGWLLAKDKKGKDDWVVRRVWLGWHIFLGDGR